MALDWKKTSQWWYGRFTEGGRTKLVNLRVKIAGVRPVSITGDSRDSAFLQSRGRAIQEHDRILKTIKERGNLEELTQRIIELKTGKRSESVKLSDLPDAWEKIPRKRVPCQAHIDNKKSILRKFVKFILTNYRDVEEMADVTRDMMAAFMESETERGISGRSWNIVLTLIRGVFRRLEPTADAFKHYLAGTPGKVENTVHREPFAPNEILAILDAAEDDSHLRPVIVTALCTAMRRGDCCLLKWTSVDLDSGFITVKTAKTGDAVEIPIMPLLMKEFKQLPRDSGEYVFPQVAAMYQKSPDAINRRMKHVLLKAGFIDEDMAKRFRNDPKALLAILPGGEICKLAQSAISGMKATEKKKSRMIQVLAHYQGGATIPVVSDRLGISEGSVSGLLNEIEGLISAQVIRRPWLPPGEVRGVIQVDGKGARLKMASVKGWHSFRTTWITLALSAGLPMELVRRVSGHTTADVVLKHYFRPGREQFRDAMQQAMPRLMMNGEKSRDEQLLEILQGMTVKTWRRDRDKGVTLLKQTSNSINNFCPSGRSRGGTAHAIT
jgi:integrase